MRVPSHRERGSALLVAMAASAVLLLLIAGLFTFVSSERVRASRSARDLTRRDCAQAGLLLARSYFADNAHVGNWNTYLADTAHYNPVHEAWMDSHVPALTAADPVAAMGTWAATAPYSDLFYDLDGDGKPDVYIYIRDNQDELLPAANNYLKDNDQNVFVGAVCISNTLVPRLQNGKVDPAQLSVESLLSYNTPSNGYGGQAAGGASGDGNTNPVK